MNKYHIKNRRYSSGQSTVEFIIACLVMIPLFVGIYYFARYSDIKSSAIQASRYAAFERTWDPTSNIKSDDVLKEEVRARFFTKIEKINYQDTPAGAVTSVPLWVDVKGSNLITNHSGIVSKSDPAGKLQADPVGSILDGLNSLYFQLPSGGMIKSQVNVPLANIGHFEPLKSINITLPAATAIGSGSWNAAGAKGADSVCDRALRPVLSRYFDVGSIVSFAMSLFEQSELKFGIMLPDYVPPGSVRTNNSPGPSSTPLPSQAWNPCTSARNPN
jgi:hypothetical protein